MSKRVLILGKDPSGKAKYANVTESGDLRVQLSGANVEEIMLLDMVEVRDTTAVSTPVVDISKYTSFEVVAVSTLGKEIHFVPRFDDTGNSWYYYDMASNRWVRFSMTDELGHGVIPAQTAAYRYLLSTVFPAMFNVKSTKLRITFQAQAAPTSGILIVWLWGCLR